jgi:peptide deformylase
VALDVNKLKIVLYPDPVLRVKARPVEAVTDEVRAAARRMLELMHAAPGVGLAATQVGIDLRFFVANPSGQPEDDQVFINPVLDAPSREMQEADEGCLSLPEVQGMIRRPKSITIHARNLEGRAIELTSDQLAARIWQHETDHLDGVLIIDRMAPLDRLANQKRLREMERAGEIVAPPPAKRAASGAAGSAKAPARRAVRRRPSA